MSKERQLALKWMLKEVEGKVASETYTRAVLATLHFLYSECDLGHDVSNEIHNWKLQTQNWLQHHLNEMPFTELRIREQEDDLELRNQTAE